MMNWSKYLRDRTRRPEFLWRLVIWVLAAGIGLGYVAEKVWFPPAAENNRQQLEELLLAAEDLDVMAAAGEWSQLWWSLPEVAYRYDRIGPVALATIAGCCWLLFLWQALLMPGLKQTALWCALLAVPLGILSIWPTLFFHYWMEEVWNLREEPELIPGIRYFVLSVGLREELSKLVCLLPLMPILLKLRNELTVLLVSGCVGLGFAIEENIGYFSGQMENATLGRFLTANPLHIALTGMSGLALYRAFRNPKGWASHSLGLFGMLVFAHGMYDAFIVVPGLAKEYSWVCFIIFALVMYQFFGELRELRPRQRDTISLSANFLAGVSILTAVTFVYLSGSYGLTVAFDSLAGSLFSLAIMVYLFLREMPETMVSV